MVAITISIDMETLLYLQECAAANKMSLSKAAKMQLLKGKAWDRRIAAEEAALAKEK